MRFEEGSEVIGSFIPFFARNPIPAAKPVIPAASVNVFTSLLSDILFHKINFNPLVSILNLFLTLLILLADARD